MQLPEAEGTLRWGRLICWGKQQPFWNQYYQNIKIKNMNTCLAVQQVLFWETTILLWGTFMRLQIKESFLLTPKDGMRLKPQCKASLRTFPRAIREDTIAIDQSIVT